MGVPEREVKKPKAVFGIRHVQCVLLFFALMLAFSLRVNMSMAIVAMTDPSYDNTFNWSMQIQSVILSSFFWGYVILQVPGGLLAERIGGSTLVLISISVNSVVSLVLPTAATYGGWQAVCACRVLQGLSQGFIYPCMHNLIGKWAPLEEKSRLGTLIYAGAQLGTAVQLMIAGFLADYWGWESIFYVMGTCGIVWVAIYAFIGAASPQVSKMISDEERLYIQNSLGHVGGHKTYPTPWKSLFTSIPFLSLILVHCAQNWGFWTLMTEIPSYMSQVLGVDIKANGVMSALPYIAMYLLSFPVGFISDFVLAKGWMSTSVARKISNSIGHFGPAISLIGLAYVPAGNITLAVALLSIVVGLNAGHYTGFMLVHLDMSPNFAGTMMGVTNGLANLVSIIAPLAAGAIIKDETDAGEWRKVFYLASFIYIVGNTLFLIFGTSERQSWNESIEKESIENATESTSEKTEKAI
ncbi:putative inorganic phosphate cotransporter [Choristoneura fumiferana]|uniref:putative inorganic phosphate cotransporter n=1 Tax=Choristoneura fumiferana TaxID=7141 RepID=UPI003D1580DA